MPAFTITVDNRNLERRVENLSTILGPSHGGTASANQTEKMFQFGRARYNPRSQVNKTELEIIHSVAGDSAKFKTVVAELRSLFPEMVFKSGLLDKIMAESKYFRYVICRGFVGTSSKGVTPQQLEFVLVNTHVENAMVIAQDSLDSTHKQLLFLQAWDSVQTFVKDLVEAWIVGERIAIERVGEITVSFFDLPSKHAFSESFERWLPLPCTEYSRSWPSVSQENLEKRYAVVGPEATYADTHHAYAVLFGRAPEQIRYGCFFYVPDYRGRILAATAEAKETTFEAVASVENPLAFPLKLRVSCVPELGQPEVFAADAPEGEVTFPIQWLPKEVKAELFLADDLVDRVTWQAHGTGLVETLVKTTPSHMMTIEIALPVRNEVIIGASKMVPAYTRFFIMENTLRAVLREELRRTYGTKWVEQIEPLLLIDKKSDEKDRIVKAMKERPEQILEYVYYYDLKAIIDKFWNVFKPIFPHKERVLLKLEELEKLRNDIAHNRVLSDHDVKRIEVYYMDLLSKA
jgi:hypothetical protein